MAVFYGQPDSLGMLRAPLRESITAQVLENQPMNEENLNHAIKKITEDMQADIESACVSIFRFIFWGHILLNYITLIRMF